MEGYCVWFFLLLLANVHGLSRNETSRGLDPEYEELLVQILSVKIVELGKLVQSGREFLHKIREWHGSHPAESILAKCVLHYWIEVKVPGLVATADEDEIGKRGLSTPVWIKRHAPKAEPQSVPNFHDSKTGQVISKRKLVNGEFVGESISTPTSVRSINDDEKFKFKRKVVKTLYLLYMEIRDLLSEHKLIDCSFHYLISKFWQWVDNAP